MGGDPRAENSVLSIALLRDINQLNYNYSFLWCILYTLYMV